jgi:hypothetical protein
MFNMGVKTMINPVDAFPSMPERGCCYSGCSISIYQIRIRSHLSSISGAGYHRLERDNRIGKVPRLARQNR